MTQQALRTQSHRSTWVPKRILTHTFTSAPDDEGWEETLARFDLPGQRHLDIHDGLSDIRSELIERATRWLDEAPDRLSQSVRFICMPSRQFPANEQRGVLASADPLVKGVVIWPDADRNFTQLVLEHELSHIAGTDGGVPLALRRRWERARARDAARFRGLRGRRVRRHAGDGVEVELKGGSLRRRFDPGSGFVSFYAASRSDLAGQLMEDWAEAVSFFLLDRRHGSLYVHRGTAVRFKSLFPHRANLIERWISDIPYRRFGVRWRTRQLSVGHWSLSRIPNGSDPDGIHGRWLIFNRQTHWRRIYGRPVALASQ